MAVVFRPAVRAKVDPFRAGRLLQNRRAFDFDALQFHLQFFDVG